MNHVELKLKSIVDMRTKRLFHAALEMCNNLLIHTKEFPHLQSQCLFELGVIYHNLAESKSSLTHFEQAAEVSVDRLTTHKYKMHEAIAHARLSDYDRALRVIVQVLHEAGENGLSEYLAPLYINLSFVYGLNQFYRESLLSAERSLEIYLQGNSTPPYAEIYNNIGIAYLEQHLYDEAEEYLLKSIESEDNAPVWSLSELSRLYFSKKDLVKTIAYGTKAARSVWESMVSFEKDEVARLCRLLAQVSYQLGESQVAMRLLEKAQLMFGQLGMWREWDDAQTQMEDWLDGKGRIADMHIGVTIVEIERFITFLDVMNAQELIRDDFATLLDTRTLYAGVLADAMNLSDDDKQKLALACRFADYGLTALEPEVIANPRRSTHAWDQYRRHPDLSVNMLEALTLNADVLDIIADHHEHYDGSGYPRRKSGENINYFSRILAVVDRYAWNVVVEQQLHSQAFQSVAHLSGTEFDARIVEAFEGLFHH